LASPHPMIRFLILRVIVPLLLLLLARSVLRSLFKSFQSASNQTPEVKRPHSGGELKKDPVCGAYVAASSGLTRRIQGETIYFCSPECRDKYRAA
jgi:YHS domain-containing protein